jgi:arylformamidase
LAIIGIVQFHDISAPLRDDLPTWPGEEGLSRTLVATQPADDATVSHLAFGAHTGTHIDAPVHFLAEGGGIDSFDTEAFVGSCFVADLRHVPELVTGDDLNDAGIPEECIRVLALTRNSGWSRGDTEFRSDYVAFSASAADWCLRREVRLLGNDYLSVEAYQNDGFPVHKTLLGAGVALLEGIDLEGVAPGPYELVALPILVPGSDGAPARAVLIER